MKCQECGLQKKTIKGLKMHIKLLHLRTGKFQCGRCEYSANMLNSISTHYKIKHPDAAEQPDYEERSDDKMIFSHDFWKDQWGIPTLNERKALIRYVNFSSVTAHYNIKHRETLEQPDYEERSDDKMIFSHDFWKDQWGIQTLNEQKALI